MTICIYLIMELDSVDSNNKNEFIDKKLQKIVNKSLALFSGSGIGIKNVGSNLAIISDTDKIQNQELTNVSDMISKMLGSNLNEKDQMEFKLGLVELIDSVESKYIENPSTRNIINKVLLMLLSRFKAK